MAILSRLIVAALALSPASGFVGPASVRAPSALNAATISAKEVQKLRKDSGAGMMDCKKALVEADGDFEAASGGSASRASRPPRRRASAAKEGLVETYVHTGGKLGVMVEVNCETDFVSKGEKFHELAKMLAMQIAACPAVEYVKPEDIPESARDAERAIEMKNEDLEGKPEEIKVKMVEGRVNKMFKENILLEQAYIKDPQMTVADFVASYVAVLGENIQVTRFTKFNLGETGGDDDEE
ncbi:hypothetical protein JL722_189 [Aureococcus anophagefferens]|nr:hypothetical protein JL722_189 [Aureococcus anophagefferens]